jgi:hypothetical protein
MRVKILALTMAKIMRTQEQIDAEIAKLTEQAPRLGRSAFGDNHADACRAQIEVLKEGLDEAAIDDKRADMADEAQAEDDSLWADNVVQAACDARDWREGDSDDAPSDGWKSLVGKPTPKFIPPPPFNPSN